MKKTTSLWAAALLLAATAQASEEPKAISIDSRLFEQLGRPATAAQSPAEPKTIRINIGNGRQAGHPATAKKARELIGSAIAQGTVDSLTVFGPDAPYSASGLDGRLFACAGQGAKAKPGKFDALVRKLSAIPPGKDGYVQVEVGTDCQPSPPRFCGGFAAIQCPQPQVCVIPEPVYPDAGGNCVWP